MGLSQSLWTGLSGLKVHQSWTDVVGNNLTNANTEGFKYSQVNFSDILYNTQYSGSPASGDYGSMNPKQVGTGVDIASISRNFTQGNLELTDRTFDCALEGQGFFVFGDLDGSVESGDGFYSRNGSFYLGSPETGALEQPLLSSEGLSVYGYNASGGVLSTSLESLYLPSQGTLLPGIATSEIDWSGNLFSGDDPVSANEVQTATSGNLGTAGGWISDNGSQINIGGVESTSYLYDESGTSGSVAASATTDLMDLAFKRSGGEQSLFDSVPSGFTADSRQIEVEFTKGGLTYTSTFTYGEDGTTLEDFSNWLTGGLGDDGTSDTQRLDGGALGTIRTRAYTEAGDGFDAMAEQAGGYLRSDGTGTIFSVASNLGSQNTVSNIRITTLTHMVNASTGEERNAQSYFSDFFNDDPNYEGDLNGGSAGKGVEVFTADSTATGGVTEEYRNMHFTLINRDSDGSTWRWIMDGQELDDTGALNKGTGIVRFGTDPSAESQVIAQTTDGGNAYTFDFTEMTQMSADDNLSPVQDGYDYGELSGYTIDQYGVIGGVYTNGLTETLGKLATAIIPNPDGMIAVGSTLFALSNVSGEAEYNTPDNDLSLATIRSNYLESSNVDMAREMSNLILSQRGYQVSSTIVTTSDEMLKTAYQMKA